MSREDDLKSIERILARVFMRGVSYGMAMLMKSEGGFKDLTEIELSRLILTESELNSIKVSSADNK